MDSSCRLVFHFAQWNYFETRFPYLRKDPWIIYILIFEPNRVVLVAFCFFRGLGDTRSRQREIFFNPLPLQSQVSYCCLGCKHFHSTIFAFHPPPFFLGDLEWRPFLPPHFFLQATVFFSLFFWRKNSFFCNRDNVSWGKEMKLDIKNSVNLKLRNDSFREVPFCYLATTTSDVSLMDSFHWEKKTLAVRISSSIVKLFKFCLNTNRTRKINGGRLLFLKVSRWLGGWERFPVENDPWPCVCVLVVFHGGGH